MQKQKLDWRVASSELQVVTNRNLTGMATQTVRSVRKERLGEIEKNLPPYRCTVPRKKQSEEDAHILNEREVVMDES